MMITFQRQIESVGLHRALISRVSDRVERRCSCIRFHRRQRASRQRRGQVTNRQALRAKATPSALCIQKQWDPGRQRGPRQTCWNYSFPPTGSGCTTLRLPALCCWRLKLSAYHNYTISLPANKKLKWKLKAESHRGRCWSEAKCVCQTPVLWLAVELAAERSTYRKAGKICMPLHGPTK